jgi:hypothetical protein
MAAIPNSGSAVCVRAWALPDVDAVREMLSEVLAPLAASHASVARHARKRLQKELPRDIEALRAQAAQVHTSDLPVSAHLLATRVPVPVCFGEGGSAEASRCCAAACGSVADVRRCRRPRLAYTRAGGRRGKQG